VAARLTVGARELEAFIDRWEQRLTSLEKASGAATTELVHRIDGKVARLIGEARSMAFARWKHDASVFVCGTVVGLVMGFGVPYYWRGENLAQDTHDVLVKILENTNARRAAAEAAAKAAPSPQPRRAR
jgi:hypothetical protein